MTAWEQGLRARQRDYVPGKENFRRGSMTNCAVDSWFLRVLVSWWLKTAEGVKITIQATRRVPEGHHFLNLNLNLFFF